MTDKKVLILLGMHRSGTSLLTNWLWSMGLDVGQDLLKGGIGNVNGHFEDRDFHDVHESIFRKNGISYGGLQGPLDIVLDKTDKDQLIKNVESKNASNRQWGWKEPRTCLFLNEYKTILPEAKYLIVYRSCDDVVNSLLKRHIKLFNKNYPAYSRLNKLKFFLKKNIYHDSIVKNNQDAFIQSWVIYNNNILKLIEELNRDQYIICDLKKMLSRDQEIYDQISQDWGFNLKYTDFSEIFDESLISNKTREAISNDSWETILRIEEKFKALLNER